jgi:hypothetical protein
MPILSRNDFLVLNTTGPGLLSRTLAENPHLARSVTVLFPTDVCDIQTWNRFGELGVHLMEGSWRPTSGFIRRRITQLWEVWRMDRLMRQSRSCGPSRSHLGPYRRPQ